MVDHLYQHIVDKLIAQLANEGEEIQLQPASDDSVQWLRSKGIPEPIVSFFVVAEPSQWIYIKGVEIGPVDGLKEVNTNAIPGIVVNRFGYVVIAKCISGDVYCVKTHRVSSDGQLPMYIVKHDRIWDAASEQEVEAWVRQVVGTFDEFLSRFVEGNLPYDFDHLGR